MAGQRYVSEELTHFVGRGKPIDEQYATLIEILRTGALSPFGSEGSEQAGMVYVMSRASRALVTEHEMFDATTVCFCDIPIGDIEIHTAKYSRFGLAFKKSFLLSKGASPVFYVAKDARSKDLAFGGSANGGTTNQEVYERGMEAMQDLFMLTEEAFERVFPRPEPDEKGSRPLGEQLSRLWAVERFLTLVFSHLKFFDGSTADEDPANYYMEREWRVVAGLDFELADVYRVFLPPEFAPRLRGDVPDYQGQVTFA